MASPESKSWLQEAYEGLFLPKSQLEISQDDQLLFLYREMVRKELDGKGFFTTPDIPSAQDLTIDPGGLAFIPVTLPEEVSQQFSEFHPYALSVLSATTRSRYAQAGLEVRENGLMGNAISARNLSNRPFSLSKGEAFFYLYYWNGQTVRGKELSALAGQGETNAIQILGEEGKVWKKWYMPNTDHTPENLEGIEFMIDMASKKWIAPSIEPIRLHGNPAENHGRGMVDKYLSAPIPETDDPMLWISESSALLHLQSSVHGIVQWYVSDNNYDYQTNSVLFKGGNTFGKMRNEIWSPTTKEKIPTSVIMRFVKSGIPPLPSAV